MVTGAKKSWYCISAGVSQDGVRCQYICRQSAFDLKAALLEWRTKKCEIDRVVVQIDVGIDGADEVDEDVNLIKGGGGCLTQEKIIASCCREFVIIGDNL